MPPLLFGSKIWKKKRLASHFLSNQTSLPSVQPPPPPRSKSIAPVCRNSWTPALCGLRCFNNWSWVHESGGRQFAWMQGLRELKKCYEKKKKNETRSAKTSRRITNSIKYTEISNNNHKTSQLHLPSFIMATRLKWKLLENEKKKKKKEEQKLSKVASDII